MSTTTITGQQPPLGLHLRMMTPEEALTGLRNLGISADINPRDPLELREFLYMTLLPRMESEEGFDEFWAILAADLPTDWMAQYGQIRAEARMFEAGVLAYETLATSFTEAASVEVVNFETKVNEMGGQIVQRMQRAEEENQAVRRTIEAATTRANGLLSQTTGLGKQAEEINRDIAAEKKEREAFHA